MTWPRLIVAAVFASFAIFALAAHNLAKALTRAVDLGGEQPEGTPHG